MKKYFITGLITLLPLTLTILVLIFVVNLLTKPFMGFMIKMLSHTEIQQMHPQLLKYASEFIILVGIFLFTLLLGIFARWFFFNTLINVSDKIIHKIPLVNKVYKTTQEIIKTLFITDKNSFKQVVMAPFPHKGLYTIGFISRKAPEACNDIVEKDMISVFIPTTPNPTTGFLIMFDVKDLIYIDMKPEDAIKYVVSCGVIIPDKNEEQIKS
ncbi:MAG: DUF502 domain-containing protein [Parachlamydiales bacterium]|jgi:uncharacterized membrane protein